MLGRIFDALIEWGAKPESERPQLWQAYYLSDTFDQLTGLIKSVFVAFLDSICFDKIMGLRSYVRVYTASDSCCTCRSVQLSKQFEKRYYDVIVHSLKSFDNRLIYLMVASSKLIAWEVRTDLFLYDDQHDRSTCVRRALKSLSGN